VEQNSSAIWIALSGSALAVNLIAARAQSSKGRLGGRLKGPDGSLAEPPPQTGPPVTIGGQSVKRVWFQTSSIKLDAGPPPAQGRSAASSKGKGSVRRDSPIRSGPATAGTRTAGAWISQQTRKNTRGMLRVSW